MSGRLQGKVCIVTGGAQGIGLATVRKFVAEGAKVAVCDIRAASIDYALARSGSDDVAGYTVDVTRRAEVDAMVAQVRDRFGTVDVLVNNAGITLDARLQKMTEQQFDRVLDVNLKGTFNCAQAVLAPMIEQRRGVILNASSVVGIYGNFGQTNYAASKFGVIGFVKTWSRELGPKGIRCNAVAPGFIDTPILGSMPDKVLAKLKERVPLGRLGTPEDVANVYAFLASDEASYINGAVIEVAGGLTV